MTYRPSSKNLTSNLHSQGIIMSARVSIPDTVYSGYIFDLDGTLVDSMPMHHKAWRIALQRNGAPYQAFLWDEFVAHGGMAAPDIVANLNRLYGLNMEPETVAAEKRACYDTLLETESLPCIEETVNLVKELKAKGIPYAIGTGSVRHGALNTLNSAGIADLFDIIITPDDVPPGRGKPCPDIFLLAAKHMGVEPSQCVVFEDAQPGLEAAAAAGMASVIVHPARPHCDNA